MFEEELLVDRLVSGDRPSIYAFGFTGMESIKRYNMAVFMVDILGRVHLMPPESVRVVKAPRVEDETLNKLEEEDAIKVMLAQGDTDEVVVEYLKRREERKNANTDL